MLLRSLLTLLIVVVALSASGISSIIASTAGDDDGDCCPDGAGDDASGEPDGERDRCPPLCHACACSPAFSVPSIGAAHGVVRAIDRRVTSETRSQLPASPPGRGVFHPPRRSA